MPTIVEHLSAGTGRLMLCLVLLVGAGCEVSVDPFIESGRPFTVYGYLDTATDVQVIRVIPLRQRLDEAADTLDARLTITALEQGVQYAGRDSLVHFRDGSTGHVFLVPFRPIPGWTYRLEVTRSDGNASVAETTVPLATQAHVGSPVGSQRIVQEVRWEDIDFPPFRVEVWYRFMNARPFDPFLEAVVTYPDVGRQDGDTWVVQVTPSQDRDDVLEALGVSEDAALVLLGMGMRLTMSDEQWRPPGGVFDPELLVQPGIFSNVENGFGFFGSVNQYVVEWVLDREVVERLGYQYPE